MTAPTTLPPWFARALSRYQRIAIAGPPRSGKTSIANMVADRHVMRTDDLLNEDWERVPHLIMERLRGRAAFIVEGVQVPRALRKGLVVDAVVWMPAPKVTLTPGQAAMAKAVASVFEQWRTISAGRVPVIVEPGATGRAA